MHSFIKFQIYNLKLQAELTPMSLPMQVKTLSNVVQLVSEKIKQSLKADHCLLLFIPNVHIKTGVFYNF